MTIQVLWLQTVASCPVRFKEPLQVGVTQNSLDISLRASSLLWAMCHAMKHNIWNLVSKGLSSCKPWSYIKLATCFGLQVSPLWRTWASSSWRWISRYLCTIIRHLHFQSWSLGGSIYYTLSLQKLFLLTDVCCKALSKGRCICVLLNGTFSIPGHVPAFSAIAYW